ncbi:hypothetical protein FRC11_012755 [Ceratobasidium sp. 423]|nr:hypothetical protein FRC11_012755 [Ceratobasidium sp. 423]
MDGRDICLVDTPGFDDSSMEDIKVLEKIGDFMARTYHSEQLFAGIIYMHRITDIRFSGIARKNFRVFRKLCGPNAMKNLIICTNMWPNSSNPADPILDGLESREEELKTSPEIFQPALAEGARLTRYMRHQGPVHAREIIRLCLANVPVATQYQEEVSRGAKLGETSAGRVLEEDMQRLMRSHKDEIARLVQEHEDAIRAKDEATRREIAEEREQRQNAVTELQRNINVLNNSLGAANQKIKTDKEEYDRNSKKWQDKIKKLETELKELQDRLEVETDPGIIARLMERISDVSEKIAQAKKSSWEWLCSWFGGK